ncbi:hypothetical protein D3C79_796400 [compost metagenome]
MPNIRLQQISCLGGFGSSSSRHGVPASSRAVFSTTTLNFLRSVQGSALARSIAVLMPIPSKCALIRRPTPHTSDTAVFRSTQSRLNGSQMLTTPPVCACSRFAVWFASLARVLVPAMPTPTGMPVQRSTCPRIRRPSASRPVMPVRSAKASSML